MSLKSIAAVFDGKVLRPVEPVDLEPNTTYEITIVAKAPPEVRETAWDVLDRMTGSVEGPGDASAELDHYLYGTPKRGSGEGR